MAHQEVVPASVCSFSCCSHCARRLAVITISVVFTFTFPYLASLPAFVALNSPARR